MPEKESQGIVRDNKGQEQPADKERAQTATTTGKDDGKHEAPKDSTLRERKEGSGHRRG